MFYGVIVWPFRSDYKIEEHVEESRWFETRCTTTQEVCSSFNVFFFFWLNINQWNLRAFCRSCFPSNEQKCYDCVLAFRLRSNNSGPSEKFCLTSDLVVLILSRLALKENIRSSLVCKKWCEIAASVRVRDPPCWLMYFDPCRVRGVSYGFYDPVEKKKTKAIYLSELSKHSHVVCSNDGWLLMRDFASHVNLFFFNPFTRDRINLPRFDGIQAEYAFSCAPTKEGCLVFGINGFSSVAVTISTWHPGATTWVMEDFPNLIPSYFKHTKNVLYSDGLFYMSSQISLGVFDPSARTWNALPVQPVPSPSPEMHTLRWMTEYKGQIFLVDASSPDPMVFRLNRLEMVWERKETLDGSSIFVSDGSCVMTTGLTGSMSNIVYVWNNHIGGKYITSKDECPFQSNRPIKYSLYSRSLCEDPEGYYFEYQTEIRNDGVWIEPPHDISIFDFSILDHSDAINMPLLIWSFSFI